MNWYTEAQRDYLKLLLRHAEETNNVKIDTDPHPATNAARLRHSDAQRHFYNVEVSFDKIVNDEERQFFETIPTKFTLPAESVDRLREVGGTILDADSVFQELLAEIGTD